MSVMHVQLFQTHFSLCTTTNVKLSENEISRVHGHQFSGLYNLCCPLQMCTHIYLSVCVILFHPRKYTGRQRSVNSPLCNANVLSGHQQTQYHASCVFLLYSDILYGWYKVHILIQNIILLKTLTQLPQYANILMLNCPGMKKLPKTTRRKILKIQKF